MTEAAPLTGVEYASAHACPICSAQPVSEYHIYGHPVCRSCYSGFYWRRLGAYVIDSLIMIIPSVIISFTIALILSPLFHGWLMRSFMNMIPTAIVSVLFAMKDGINGQSPARMMLDLLVVDDSTGKPISFVQSLQRNSFVLLGIIPLVGWLPATVLALVIAFTLGKGYRLGDAFANTRVIWKRYASSPVFGSVNQPAFEVTPLIVPAMS